MTDPIPPEIGNPPPPNDQSPGSNGPTVDPEPEPQAVDVEQEDETA